jgi:hypothetical protein
LKDGLTLKPYGYVGSHRSSDCAVPAVYQLDPLSLACPT